MWIALSVIGVFAVLLWFVRGFMRSQRRREDERLQAYYDSLSETRKADDLLRDPDHVKRLRDTFND